MNRNAGLRERRSGIFAGGAPAARVIGGRHLLVGRYLIALFMGRPKAGWPVMVGYYHTGQVGRAACKLLAVAMATVAELTELLCPRLA